MLYINHKRKNNERKQKGKKTLKIILIFGLIIATGFGGYCVYGLYKINQLSDMAQYVQIHMGDELDYLSTAHEELLEVDKTRESYEKMGIFIDAIGIDWMIDHKNNIIWHNGGTGNYNSYIGFDKENQIAVVILSNLPPNHRIPAAVMGIKILTSLQK